MHRSLPAAFRVLCCSLLLALAACDAGGPAGPQPGAPLPPLRLSDLASERELSTAQWRGSVLVINFWATWCEPCRQEMPSLEALQQRFAGKRLQVIGITMDDDLNLAREFLLARGITFPNHSEVGDARARDLLSVQLLPETVVVDASGNIAMRVTGARNWAGADTVAELDGLLRGLPPRD